MHRKLFCSACLLLGLLAGCSPPAASLAVSPPDLSVPARTAAAPEPSSPPAPTLEPTPAPAPASASASIPAPASASAPASTREPAPVPVPTPEPTPAPEPYQFGVPLGEGEPVEDDSFFDSAVFLGDSRTEGFQLFSGMKHGDFYWGRGMTVFRAGSEDYRPFNIGGRECSMLEALALKQYDSVYVMLGVNELGCAAASYESGLGELMDRITAAQPEAVVYLQLMPPLNDAMCRQHSLAHYINNTNLTAFNEAITRVAADKHVILLNTAEAYTGEDGQLPADIAGDGCHFAVSGYARWADYLRCHTADRERYFYSREQAAEQASNQADESTAEQAPE